MYNHTQKKKKSMHALTHLELQWYTFLYSLKHSAIPFQKHKKTVKKILFFMYKKKHVLDIFVYKSI